MNLSPRYSAVVALTGRQGALTLGASASEQLQLDLARFFVGARGPSGAESQVSADQGNAISTGTDGGLFVPQDPFLATQDW